jgi:hypothetical protein
MAFDIDDELPDRESGKIRIFLYVYICLFI